MQFVKAFLIFPLVFLVSINIVSAKTFFTVNRHVNTSFTNNEFDSKIDDVNERLRTDSGHCDDVSCSAEFGRDGDVGTFGSAGDGLDDVDSRAKHDRVFDAPGDIKVVTKLSQCGDLSKDSIIACARCPAEPKGTINIIVEADVSGNVYVHEYGHNIEVHNCNDDLGHRNDCSYNIMYWQSDGNNDSVNEQECKAFGGSVIEDINPTIAQTPMEGPIGTSCRQWGTGFTPNSTGKLYFQMVEGGAFDSFPLDIKENGNFDIPYVFNKPPGQYIWYAEDVIGARSNEVTYTITGSTTSSTPTAYPKSRTWTSSPQYISVSCGNADRIYCTVRTAYGSIPEDPPIPTMESHDFFDDSGTDHIDSSGTFKIWGQSEQLKYIKVRFRGYNSEGYGPTSDVFLYAIDLRSNDPGDIGITDGPDGNVKKVEIDATGNNWHHSYSAYPGQTLETRVTVTNKGDETIDYFEVTIYRSNDKNFNKDEDYKYGREEEEDDLDPGEKDHKHRTITAPSTPGTYYIFAYVNRVDGENGGEDQDWSNNYSRDDDVEEYAKLTVYPWPPPNWSIVKEENGSQVYIFYNNKKWWALSWEILSALGFKSEDLLVYADGKLGAYSSGPSVLSDGIYGELNSCIYLFESGKWHYLADWSYMDCKGGQHPENVIPITQALFNMYAGGADVDPCIRPEELQALIALYDSTNGPEWLINTNWKTDADPNTWTGVTVEKGRVSSLVLEGNKITGSIPPEIGNLTNLQEMRMGVCWAWPELGANNLTGSIPPEIGNLTNLSVLDLGSNDLSGNIPSGIGNLINLSYLGLGGNNLTGSIPPEIGNLINLSSLHLSSNDLSGNIPSGIGNLINLPSLDLSDNQLTAIPPQIGNLTQLEGLDLSNNQLTGSIPPEIGNLINLSYLDLSENQLTGIPNEIGNLINLSSLNLWNNQLTEISPGIGNLTQLDELNLSNNAITNIPSEIGNLINLSKLYLSENQLTGIPNEIGNLVNLVWLFLDNNALTSIPPEIGNLVNLFYLLLNDNTLTSILPEVKNLTNLIGLHLGNNQFSGNIPPEILDMTNLQQLDMSGNQLAGNIPPEIGDLPHLMYLNLSNNDFLGSIPSEIGNLTYLLEMDLSKNQLTGNLPTEITNTKHLHVLSLHGNKITALPPNWSEYMTRLYISSNQLNFDSLEPYVPNTFEEFSYSPQADIPVSPNSMFLTAGETLIVSISVGGEHNQYQWFKDGVAITAISDNSDYSKSNVSTSSSGSYVCHITNTVVPDLTLYTEEMTVTVQVASDSDSDGLIDSVENNWCTNPNDADTDDDGIPDGMEDANHNGVQDTDETHPCKIDTDGDGIQDGTELGYTLNDVDPDTDTAVFQPDLDPGTTTDPLDRDTDGDGRIDGKEDLNGNGRVDPGDSDPNNPDPRAMPWIHLLLTDTSI